MDQKTPRWLWAVWTAVTVLVIVYAAFALQTLQSQPVVLPYSSFLHDVSADNVASVDIAGDQLSGHLKRPPNAFRTTFPSTTGDPGLLPLLEAHRVYIEAESSQTPWFAQLLAGALPWMLIIGVAFWLMSSARNAQTGAASGFGRSNPQRYVADGRPPVTFADVAGADAAKDELQEEVDFLRNPGKYREIGARIPKGILLAGPPGTGKTLLARAVAGEANVPFLSLNASEFVEMFVGVGASRVRDLFAKAKESAPAIVFIDELDAVGRRRGAGVGTVNDEREQTLNQLLAELDGFDQRLDVIILAATNRPDVLDPALLRPGRFDRQVVVELPDLPGREAILHIHTRKIPLAADADLHILAGATIGMSGADLENLCNEAALRAARQSRATVNNADFEAAADKLRMGAVRPSLADPSERRVVAYHEAGHALAAWLTPLADPVRKVTIVPRGQALGHTEQIPGEEHHNFSRSYLRVRLIVALSGRCAEEIAFGEVTTGAEADLVDATGLARRMVTRFGMGEQLAAFASDAEQPFLGYAMAQGRDYSEATAARLDREVTHLLEEAYGDARQILGAQRGRLDALADALMKKETIEYDELKALLGQQGTGDVRSA